jgi:hypothetical protein
MKAAVMEIASMLGIHAATAAPVLAARRGGQLVRRADERRAD